MQVSRDAEWQPNDKDLIETCWRTFAVPGTTKVHLEDIFNCLRDKQRTTKNKRMGCVWPEGLVRKIPGGLFPRAGSSCSGLIAATTCASSPDENWCCGSVGGLSGKPAQSRAQVARMPFAKDLEDLPRRPNTKDGTLVAFL